MHGDHSHCFIYAQALQEDQITAWTGRLKNQRLLAKCISEISHAAGKQESEAAIYCVLCLGKDPYFLSSPLYKMGTLMSAHPAISWDPQERPNELLCVKKPCKAESMTLMQRVSLLIINKKNV